IDPGASADYCQDPNGTYSGTFTDTDYTLTYSGEDPEGCENGSGTYTYSADGSIGTADAVQIDPSPANATLELCVTEVVVSSATTTYNGNYRLTVDGEEGSQTGDFTLGPPPPPAP
ncbi:hypothetical protein MK280_00205, partial [Myxococcota bacterium]|nr:hypothetical protein [Myxococcota bacterium]